MSSNFFREQFFLDQFPLCPWLSGFCAFEFVLQPIGMFEDCWCPTNVNDISIKDRIHLLNAERLNTEWPYTEWPNTERPNTEWPYTEDRTPKDIKSKNTEHRMTERRIGPNVENDMNFYTIKCWKIISPYLMFKNHPLWC